jgi:murein DD-endopeptidase MepM/ murein hydrolase activator NlpD
MRVSETAPARPPGPRTLLPVVAALTLAAAASVGGGCEDAADPAPADAPGDGEPGGPPASEATPEPVFVEHEVQEGETLWAIARAYELPVSAVMEANALRPRDVRRLSKGKVLKIPGATEVVDVAAWLEATRIPDPSELPRVEDGAYHFLGRGETLWDLARIYDVSLDALVARNELDDDRVRGLRPGMPVVIPGASRKDIQRPTPEAPSTGEGLQHTLARGETVWTLANAFQVSVAEIMAANGLSEDQVATIREGTRLYVPGVQEDDRGRVRRTLTGAQERALARARRVGLGDRGAANAVFLGRLEPAWLRLAGGRRRLPGTLRWPVARGWQTRGYGSGAGGYHQAMDIMGRIGWNVRAAAPGIVAYSGKEIRGYGNMVLVVHPGGWVTMYAHNSVNFVVAGQRVPQGGILAELGSTGISRGPHVHFELIYEGLQCDPGPLFRPYVRHRTGRPVRRITKATWTRPGGRPDAVRCRPRKRHPRSRWVENE